MQSAGFPRAIACIGCRERDDVLGMFFVYDGYGAVGYRGRPGQRWHHERRG
jgi:hypothetical protein